MATIDWPTILPPGQLNPYQYQRWDVAVDTELDTGRSRVRRRCSDGPAAFQINWLMTEIQFAYFESWFLHVLAGRANAFNMIINVGSGCSAHECRFKAPYVMQGLVRPDLYRVQGQLEIRQISLWSQDFLEAIDAFIAGGDDAEGLFAFFDGLERHVNVELPASEMGA